MIFKGFKFGKAKDNGKAKAPDGDNTAAPITELEEQLKDRTNNLKQAEENLLKLSDKMDDIAEIEVTKVQPHGPIDELSIEPEDSLNGVDTDQEVEDTETALAEGEEEEKVKLVEVSAESKPASPAEKTSHRSIRQVCFSSLLPQGG